MNVKEMKGRKYELVAPESGWGYMIGLGVILNLTTLMSFVSSFGMLYKDLLIEINMDSTSVTLLNGIASLSIAISGILTSPLLKMMSLRRLGLISALIFNLGIFGTVFVKSKLSFFICQGFFMGVGNGLIFNISCTALNDYFVKRRLLAFSFTQTIVAVFQLIAPQFVKWSFETYGYRGTVLLVSAISLQNIIGMTLMQPVEWHLKKVEIIDPNEKETLLLLMDDENLKIPVTVLSNFDKQEHINNKFNDLQQTISKDDKPKDHGNNIMSFLSRLIDFSILKTFLLSNACLGVSFTAFADLLYSVMLPQALYSIDWDEVNHLPKITRMNPDYDSTNANDVAKALSLNALGDLFTRIVFIFGSKILLKIGSQEVYIIGLVVAFLSRIGMLWSNNKTAMMSFITIIGSSHCSVMVLLPVVIADTVSQDKFTAAMGLILLNFGLFNTFVGPIVGMIRDLTDSYATAFYILSSCFCFVAVSWTIELIYKKKRSKNAPMYDISDK